MYCTEPTTEATTEATMEATVETTAETTALNALGVDMAVAVEEERAVNPTLLAAALVAQVKGIAAGGGGWILKGWPVTEEQVSEGREGKGREGKGREGKGRKGRKGRKGGEGEGREGKETHMLVLLVARQRQGSLRGSTTTIFFFFVVGGVFILTTTMQLRSVPGKNVGIWVGGSDDGRCDLGQGQWAEIKMETAGRRQQCGAAGRGSGGQR